MTTLWLDYETRSHCDLIKRGLYNYVDDNTTRVLIASYALDDGPIKRWEAWRTVSPPADLIHALRDKSITVKAHNAAFERLITKACLKIDIPLNRWYCTSYQSRMSGCPPKLEDLARMVNPEWRKDVRGSVLMRRYSIPPFEEDREGLIQFGEYCDRDVLVMRNLSNCLLPLTDYDRKVWEANEVINDRGLPIDTELCDAAVKLADREIRFAENLMVAITGTKARGQELAHWIHERLPADQAELMERDDGKISFDRATRSELLELDLPPQVMDVITCADVAALSSTAKFKRMTERTSSDGRLRGAFVCAGAPATGRYASWGVQLHNFPRECPENMELFRNRIVRRDSMIGPAHLKIMLRAAICAGPGKFIASSDWNAIEARGLPWLVNTPAATKYLEAFQDPKRDIYVEQAIAAGLGNKRQEGKVVVLSLGYGGADGALAKMSKAYGVRIDNPKMVVAKWRDSNRWAPEWWRNLMQAASRSLKAEEPIRVGRVRFVGPGIMELPSGRRIIYPGLSYDEEGQLVYLKAAKKPAAGAAWPQSRLWHGIVAENATQATCCDLLRDLTVREMDSPLIGHVHDECIAEVRNKREAQWLQKTMTSTNEWARGMPLKAEVRVAKRFGK